MPEAPGSSHTSHSHTSHTSHTSRVSHVSHDRTVSSPSNLGVGVAVELPQDLSASAPTNLRLHNHQRQGLTHPGPQKPTHGHSVSLSISQTHSINPNSFASRAARPPRTSSLLPPPHIEPASHTSHLDIPRRQPSPIADHPQTPPRTSHSATAHSPSNNPAEVSWLRNRWSTSTNGSSRTSLAVHRVAHSRFGSRGSVDATSIVNGSPPTAKPSPRKLQKNRRPSLSSRADDVAASVSTSKDNPTPQTLPPIASLSPLEPPNFGEYLQVTTEGAGPGSSERRLPSVAGQESQSPIPLGAANSTGQTNTPRLSDYKNTITKRGPKMPHDYEGEAYMPRSHSRNRSGKGSSDRGRTHKPPSQKAMLSRALQKANQAVLLDNKQNFEGAREAYAEACELLRQVLQRTTGDEDKRKLEAIRRTYTSRIDELDQITPWVEEDTKALPARPDSIPHPPDSLSFQPVEDEGAEEVTVFETATITRGIGDGSRSPQPSNSTFTSRRANKPKPIITTLNPEPGLLQSSFSRSPIHLGPPSPFLLQRPDQHYIPAPLSPRRPPSPPKAQEDSMDEPITIEFAAATAHPVQPADSSGHGREESFNSSWLDPIDESGGSTSSSVHSRTSSLGFRRKHIRAASGNTEAEFDTALDEAIEAAYDEGYEPMSPTDYDANDMDGSGEEVVANALRKVEEARERKRQIERETPELATDFERQRQHQQFVEEESHHMGEDFFDDDSEEEEERILEEMARDYGIEQFTVEHSRKPSISRESDASGRTTRTWHNPSGSNPPTISTSLSTVKEVPPPFAGAPSGPTAPPPQTSLPEIPSQRPSSSSQSVRNRRMSGQNPKQLKIETTKLGVSLPPPSEDTTPAKSATTDGQKTGISVTSTTGSRSMVGFRRPSSPPLWEASPTDENPGPASPFRHLGPVDEDERTAVHSTSPNVTRLRKNFSSSSLRSMKSRNMSVSNVDENSDMSPGTPASNAAFGGSRAHVVPALPTPLAAAFRDRLDTAGLSLFDDNFHSPTSPGSPHSIAPDVPVPLEPCPTDFMLRPFWLMRCLYQTLAHPRGGYLSSKLFVPREVWRVKGVKLKNIEDKVANCDFLTAALLKIAKVDTCDADAVLEEMQSLEGVLEQVQSALSRKLGNEVGVQGSGTLFKEASMGAEVDANTGMPRSSSVSGKSTFSWRRLRSKNSAVGLGGAYTSRVVGTEAVKEIPSLPSLPMTGHPTSRPPKRDLTQAHFTGPNAMYMSSLARLFDAAQAIDQIARQVEDPGLRHADKTQVGLELCTRHAAEFFGFYVCRFVLADLGLLLDKFIKRGSEWVLT